MTKWLLFLISWVLLIIAIAFPILIQMNILAMFPCILFSIGFGMTIKEKI